MKYLRVYKMLLSYGHSAPKAIEIILDAKRGDSFAMSWIRLVRSTSQL